MTTCTVDLPVYLIFQIHISSTTNENFGNFNLAFFRSEEEGTSTSSLYTQSAVIHDPHMQAQTYLICDVWISFSLHQCLDNIFMTMLCGQYQSCHTLLYVEYYYITLTQ